MKHLRRFREVCGHKAVQLRILGELVIERYFGLAAQNEKSVSGRKKFGAMLGDEVEVGCGSVLNPGTVVGSHSNIYPLSSVRGFVPAYSIYKKQGEVAEKQGE